MFEFYAVFVVSFRLYIYIGKIMRLWLRMYLNCCLFHHLTVQLLKMKLQVRLSFCRKSTSSCLFGLFSDETPKDALFPTQNHVFLLLFSLIVVMYNWNHSDYCCVFTRVFVICSFLSVWCVCVFIGCNSV